MHTRILQAARVAVPLFALIIGHDAAARPRLESTCGGGIPIAFARACDAHSEQGYVPLRRQLSDGSCMNMCCQQDANGNISCVNDPSSIPSKLGGSRGVVQPVTGAVAPPIRTAQPKAIVTPIPGGVLPNKK